MYTGAHVHAHVHGPTPVRMPIYMAQSVPRSIVRLHSEAVRAPGFRSCAVTSFRGPSLRFYFNTALNPSIPQSAIESRIGGRPRPGRVRRPPARARRGSHRTGPFRGRYTAGAQIALRFDAISPTRHGRGGPGRAGTLGPSPGEHAGRACDCVRSRSPEQLSFALKSSSPARLLFGSCVNDDRVNAANNKLGNHHPEPLIFAARARAPARSAPRGTAVGLCYPAARRCN